MNFGDITEAEKQKMREELSSYIKEFREKRGSDGEQLVHYPSNFDVVANSMNRSDLISADENPWSKYLLSSDKFEDALDGDGRYRNVLSSAVSDAEQKYDKAMAQIHMYDKQLLLISRKAAQLNALEINSQSEDGGRSDRSGKSASSSTFFLTRNASEKSSNSTPRSESLVSSRTHNSDECTENDEEKQSRSSTSDGAKATRRKKNVIRENAVNVANRSSSLSFDEETRLQTLLDIDENGCAWQNLSMYGFNSTQLEKIANLDEKLRAFDRTEFAQAEKSFKNPSTLSFKMTGNSRCDENDNPQVVDVPSPSRIDYLTEQRVLREQSVYISKLDAMLHTFATQDTDLSGLVEHAPKRFTSPSEISLKNNSEQQSAILETLPHPSVVNIHRKISKKDLEDVICAAKYSFQHSAVVDSEFEEANDLQLVDSVRMSADVDNVSVISRSSSNSRIASKETINRLLRSLQFDVQKLSALRRNIAQNMLLDCDTQVTPIYEQNLHNGSNWHEFSPTRSDIDDQMAIHRELESDIFLRYGGTDRHTEVKKNIMTELETAMQSFLPQIIKPFSELLLNGATKNGYSSLPALADSFRKRVKTLKTQKGLISTQDECSDRFGTINALPAPPEMGKKLII